MKAKKEGDLLLSVFSTLQDVLKAVWESSGWSEEEKVLGYFILTDAVMAVDKNVNTDNESEVQLA